MTLLVHADARAIPLPDAYVQCVVTSPPYWGLRDYGHDEQLGLEASPDAYVAALVGVFREVWRVLREDGTVWLNLGDSYARPEGKGQHKPGDSGKQDYVISRGGGRAANMCVPLGLKSKDLIGIPWRVAFALQADGWYLRSDIIWAKPNPMPESVTDRPTKAHEYLFLLTKCESYYYDFEGAKEPASGRDPGNKKHKYQTQYHSEASEQHRTKASLVSVGPKAFRNRRTVWPIATQPYAGAHFATFPEALVEPCLQAGTPDGGCCSTCGTPYRRIVEKGEPLEDWKAACGADAAGAYLGTAQKDYAAASAQDASATKARILAGMVERRTLGWQQHCACEASEPVQSVVLDPFCGSGTVGVVCQRMARCFVGLDTKREYLSLAQARLGIVPAAEEPAC